MYLLFVVTGKERDAYLGVYICNRGNRFSRSPTVALSDEPTFVLDSQLSLGVIVPHIHWPPGVCGLPVAGGLLANGWLKPSGRVNRKPIEQKIDMYMTNKQPRPPCRQPSKYARHSRSN